MPSFKVTALRHTAPEISSGICYGVLDLPVDADKVLHTARQWVESGAASAMPYQGVLLTSPLQRCALLAQAIKDLRPDVQLVQDPRLMEMNFGCFEGVPWDDVPQANWDAWLADFAHHPFGGVESVAQFMQRVQQAISPWVPHGRVTCVTMQVSSRRFRYGPKGYTSPALPRNGPLCLWPMAKPWTLSLLRDLNFS